MVYKLEVNCGYKNEKTNEFYFIVKSYDSKFYTVFSYKNEDDYINRKTDQYKIYFSKNKLIKSLPMLDIVKTDIKRKDIEIDLDKLKEHIAKKKLEKDKLKEE